MFKIIILLAILGSGFYYWDHIYLFITENIDDVDELVRTIKSIFSDDQDILSGGGDES